MEQPIEQKINEEMFYVILQRIRPDLFVIADVIDSNRLNPIILLKFLRQLINVAGGSGWGKVITYIQNFKVVSIEGVDADKVDQSIHI